MSQNRVALRLPLALATAAAVALLASACGGSQINQGPLYVDPDGSQGTANGLFFDMPPVDDRLNAKQGDSEDWRYIIVPRSGTLTVTLNIDDPAMAGQWALHDDEGRIIHQEVFDPARGFYELPNMPVEAGLYHFQISANGGGSVYTVGAQYVADPVVAVAEPEPEPEPEVVEEEPDRKKKKRTGDRKKKKVEKKKKDPEPEDAGANVVGNREVKGTITLATELDDGTVEIVIRGVGTKNGVEKGMKGKVKGLGLTAKTTSCRNTKCNAVVKGSDARQLKQAGTVTFMVQ